MEKTPVLNALKHLIETDQVSRKEVLELFDNENKHTKLARILSYVGSLIILFAIIALVATNWRNFDLPMRMLITFGVSLPTYFMSLVLEKKKTMLFYSRALYFLATALFAIGLIVYAEERLSFNDENWMAYVFGIVALFQAAFFYFLRRSDVLIYLLFSLFLSLFFYLSRISYNELMVSLIMAFYGTSLVVAAKYLIKSKKLHLAKEFSFGLGVIISTFSFIFLSYDQGIIYGLFAVIVILGFFVLSVLWKNKTIQVTNFIGFVLFLIVMTGEYFADSVGWPLALIVIGGVVLFAALGTSKISKLLT
jgi:hypothetical protein